MTSAKCLDFCAWLLLSFFPFPVRHPLHPLCTVSTYSPFQTKIYKVSVHLLQIFCSPPTILAGWQNMYDDNQKPCKYFLGIDFMILLF